MYSIFIPHVLAPVLFLYTFISGRCIR